MIVKVIEMRERVETRLHFGLPRVSWFEEENQGEGFLPLKWCLKHV